MYDTRFALRVLRLTLLPAFIVLFAAVPRDSRAGGTPPPSPGAFAPFLSAGAVAGFEQGLDAALTPSGTARSAAAAVRAFVAHLQTGRLDAREEAAVLAHLDRLQATRPDLSDALAQAATAVRTRTVGKTAPEIAGIDLDGRPLRLTDYRGKVVVLAFTGDWCGICRSQYPYERLLLDLYRGWPFAIVAVNSDTSIAVARDADARSGLTYRSWWDGAPPGQIASAWGVTGWPTTYVLDTHGVIRYVDLQREDLLKAVRELLAEETTTAGASTPRP